MTTTPSPHRMSSLFGSNAATPASANRRYCDPSARYTGVIVESMPSSARAGTDPHNSATENSHSLSEVSLTQSSAAPASL